jgi:hypothetical protein
MPPGSQRQPGTLVGDVFKLCSSGTGKQVSQIQARPARYDTKLWMRDLMEGAAYLPK